MTSSQTQVRELFSLPKKEVIFDDFGCAYSSGILHTGRMYLTENYICFYSSIMSITKKVIIPLNDVTKVSKAKSLGLLKAIKIYTQGQAKKNSYKFQSFSDCDKTYKIIHKLWTNVSPNAQDQEQSEEEDAEVDDAQSQISMGSALSKQDSVVNRNTEQASAGARDGASFGELKALSDSNVQIKNNQQNGAQSILNNSGILDQTNNNIDLSRSQSQMNPNRISVSLPQGEEIKKDDGISIFAEDNIGGASNKSNAALNNSQESGKKGNDEKPAGIQIEKAMGQQEINEKAQQAKNKENPHEFISKEELEKLADAVPIPENFTELEKVLLQMSAPDFFNIVAIHSGTYSFEKFFLERGEQKVITNEWIKPEPPEEYDGKPVIMSSQMSAEIQIKDNPFVKVSPTTKYYKLIEKSDVKIQFKILSKCSGVPYCDTFAIEEDWMAISPSPNANCCVVRILTQVIFYKSTIFKSKIQSSSIKGSKDVWAEWVEWTKKKGIAFKEKKAPQPANKLKHGIEKSNLLFDKKNEEPQEVKEEEKKKTLKMKIMNGIKDAKVYGFEFRIEILLLIVIMLLFRIFFKLNHLESQFHLLSNQNNNTLLN